MTDMMKPVIKLPKSRPLYGLDSNNNRMVIQPFLFQQQQQYYDFLVSDKLYLDGVPAFISESDIMQLVSTCDAIEVQLRRVGLFSSGYIRFASQAQADLAYTLLNGANIKGDVRLQLKICPGTAEPQALSGILQVRNLPLQTTNKLLYDLFRPFGPMNLCKIIMEQGSLFRGTALVQYFRAHDADKAILGMNNKWVCGNIITVFPFVSKKMRAETEKQQQQTSEQPKQQQQRSVSEAAPVDFTNLYIKNLDLNVKSSDLFSHFRKYGKIISARVMKNPQTKQSKGFGFVSFSKAEEASRALQEMNGKWILSKPIVVAYHEPKKPRTQQQQQEMPGYYMPAVPPPPPPPPAATELYTTPFQARPPLANTNSPMRILSFPNGSSPIGVPSTPTTTATATLSTQAATVYVHNRPTLRRSGSIESIMTETTSKLQRQRMIEAIRASSSSGDDADDDDIVDMLLTLNRKERSLCLFNPAFLQSKIQSAKEALAIFQEEEDEEQVVVQDPKGDHADQQEPAQEEERRKEMDAFLASLEGLTTHEKKQRLGDRLFPLVKATGVRHAPKITIKLLDTVPLQDLAHAMCDHEDLKAKVDVAVALVQQQQQQQQQQ